MQSINFRTARGNLSEVLNNVEAGEEVEITRRGREPAVIVSKATFEAYKKEFRPELPTKRSPTFSKSPPPTWWLQREGIYSMMPISVPR